MDEVCTLNKCTGCAACANKCPRHCISMSEDNILGHYKPVIDSDKCVDCGVCRTVCPVLNSVHKSAPFTAYAAWCRNDEYYHTSTSGGVFRALSSYIIQQGGVVYGAAICDDLSVRHIRVEKAELLPRLSGSKYVQSRIDDTLYRTIREDLKNMRLVLFSGTPCQNAGLLAYLGGRSEFLYCVDIICHGVPSFKMFREHIAGLNIDVGAVKNYSFRTKEGFFFSLSDSNRDIVYNRPMLNDEYYLGFIKSLFYNDACYLCEYAEAERVSDITIGDFWGCGKLAINEPHSDGISVVLPSTEKGKYLFDKIKEELYYEERTVSEAVAGNSQLRNPSKRHKRNAKFKRLYSNMPFHKAYNRSFWDYGMYYRLVHRFAPLIFKLIRR